jgi:uncharacterized phage infection (PIP) family protein YhgE
MKKVLALIIALMFVFAVTGALAADAPTPAEKMSEISGKKDESFKAYHDEKTGIKAEEERKAAEKKAAEEKAAKKAEKKAAEKKAAKKAERKAAKEAAEKKAAEEKAAPATAPETAPAKK